jgi:DNA modification methylase
MKPLSEKEKQELTRLIKAGSPFPPTWQHRLFPSASTQIGKEYRLVYDGKLTREEVLAQTPAAPWQLVRSFCTERPQEGGWRNLLVWGDNLLALRELLADQQGPDRFGTRGKIKLIYIDPPFATRQDFMKDKEKAYRDKVLGAQFIEFLRRRLILLREVLADDGSIYVHLDWKKGHYLKAVLDEIFGEENFRNEIPWQRTYAHSDAGRFGIVHDTLFFYSKNDNYVFNKQTKAHSASYIASHYSQIDSDGRRFRLITMTGAGQGPPRNFNGKMIPPPAGRHWTYKQETIDKLLEEGKIVFVSTGQPNLRVYLDEMDGTVIQSIWQDIPPVNPVGRERMGYPTQKPESLLERIIRASSNQGDIVLDCFNGSGTTPAVAEKLGRRWIAMDCGKLAIYTTQKRLFSLKTDIGAAKKDDRSEPERVEDWAEHLNNAPAVLLVTDKARKGECEVTLELLKGLADMAANQKLVKKGAVFSIVCPEDKLRIPEDQLEEPEEAPGTKRIEIDGIEFRISLIEAKEKSEKEQPLPAKEFALYRAGVYDMEAIKALPWTDYRPFVLKLFAVRERSHKRYGLEMDGYIGTHSALLWNYPDYKNLTLDHGYVDDLHRTLRGKPGERFYVIAPCVAMAFAEDEVRCGETTYIFLKVPLSILRQLIERNEPAALKQPAKEADVNEVIDAVGFDFISQPQVTWKLKKEVSPGEIFTNYVLEITEFRAQTLATDPEDFQNFETFSIAMVDLNYDGKVFHLSQAFWAEDLIAEELYRVKGQRKLDAEINGKKEKELAAELKDCQRLQLRIAEHDFLGDDMMVVLCDRYGNEKTLAIAKADFNGTPRRAKKKPAKKRKKAR